ncbi:hypothetical protein [Winogradskyella immobilis]|uniref:DNA topoisomerase IV n=1 Tax=Winogradskyella immobilis TaxID=2816852 RepID=A0ABS8EQ73_9FLAO|nr:hypothetical protein [Winogradskyella immobilis]MCC1485323.1 hypothetical protein [Winogradskyella immobilis]MCG0017415.1 hypothetical protein [Winogradskyella immobilis]
MKHYSVLLIFTFLLVSCYQVERNCADYKTGKFSFNYSVDGIEKTGTFVRTESYNIDYYENIADSASIRWINDCEFILKKLHPKNQSEEAPIHMKILSTTDSSYTFEYKLTIKKPNRPLRVEKGIAYKVK